MQLAEEGAGSRVEGVDAAVAEVARQQVLAERAASLCSTTAPQASPQTITNGAGRLLWSQGTHTFLQPPHNLRNERPQEISPLNLATGACTVLSL